MSYVCCGLSFVLPEQAKFSLHGFQCDFHVLGMCGSSCGRESSGDALEHVTALKCVTGLINSGMCSEDNSSHIYCRDT